MIVPSKDDPWLRTPGSFVFEVRDFFRRRIASGFEAVQMTCFVLGRIEAGRIHDDQNGLKVRRPFSLEGPGLAYTMRMLGSLGNSGEAINLLDDHALSRAVAFRPFLGVVVAGPDTPTQGRPRRFISITRVERLPSWAPFERPEWNGCSIGRPDPREAR